MRKDTLSLWLILAFAVGVIFFFNVKGAQFYLVPSDSMEPTLMRSDYIGAFSVKPSELQRGDIVVFISGLEGDFYVKRVIGLPGDVVSISRGIVYINGSKMDEPYVAHREEGDLPPVKIPDGHIFVMGDNRSNSVDSRRHGPISTRLVETRASFIYSPVSRMGRVE